MKNKAFLPILEQLVMILIFSVACVVCLRVFSLANQISQDRDSLDKAVVITQNAAEILKSNDGDLITCAQILSGNTDDEKLTVFYDADGKTVESLSKAYFILAVIKSNSPNDLTECAQIRVTQNGKTVYELEILWQTEATK